MTVHALPGALPAGERILWQGSPDWRAIARDTLHLRGLTAYCSTLVAWVAGSELWHGLPLGEVAIDTGRAALAAVVPLAIGLGYAWLAARAATYTITSKRVVMRLGTALPMSINLPFTRIESAGLRMRSGGTGEIKLQITKGVRPSSLLLWPHARIWGGQPMLRALKDADRAGIVLSRALAASVDAPVPLAQQARVVDNAAITHGATTVAA